MKKDYDIVLNKANATDLSAAHISASLENYEAARSGFFIFQPASATDPVLQLIADKVKEYDTNSTLTAEKVQEILRLNITESAAPSFSLELLQYRRGNEVVKFAGVPTFSDGSIKIDDIIGVDTKSIIHAWKELAYDLKTYTGGRMYEYKMDCNLTEYTQDYRPVRTWLLKGCFVQQVNEQGFSKESDGKRAMDCTIPYDRATMVRGISGSSLETEKIAG